MPSEFDYDDDLGVPNIAIMGASGSDVPLVDDGYRTVGTAQAMVDYAKPLMDKAESEEDLKKALTFAQLLWNLALTGRSDDEMGSLPIHTGIQTKEIGIKCFTMSFQRRLE